MGQLFKNISNLWKEKTKDLTMTQKTLVIASACTALLIVVSAVADSIGDTGITGNSYKEFNTPEEIAELKNMSCKDLLKKNVGKRRDWCGTYYAGWHDVYIAKQDLYNSETRYCGNMLPMNASCQVKFLRSGAANIRKLDEMADGLAIRFNSYIVSLENGEFYFSDIIFKGYNDYGFNH